MKRVDLEVGQDAWIYGLNREGNLSKGRVALVVQIPGYDYPHYIIEFTTSIESVFEVRDPYTVTDDPKLPIGAFRSDP